MVGSRSSYRFLFLGDIRYANPTELRVRIIGPEDAQSLPWSGVHDGKDRHGYRQ